MQTKSVCMVYSLGVQCEKRALFSVYLRFSMSQVIGHIVSGLSA